MFCSHNETAHNENASNETQPEKESEKENPQQHMFSVHKQLQISMKIREKRLLDILHGTSRKTEQDGKPRATKKCFAQANKKDINTEKYHGKISIFTSTICQMRLEAAHNK